MGYWWWRLSVRLGCRLRLDGGRWWTRLLALFFQSPKLWRKLFALSVRPYWLRVMAAALEWHLLACRLRGCRKVGVSKNGTGAGHRVWMRDRTAR
jgi:hypothetical protein